MAVPGVALCSQTKDRGIQVIQLLLLATPEKTKPEMTKFAGLCFYVRSVLYRLRLKAAIDEHNDVF